MKRSFLSCVAVVALTASAAVAQQSGHAGHNPAGESHFSLAIESAAFTGLTRVQRQRAVYAALGDLMHERVHALSIRALAPGEGQ